MKLNYRILCLALVLLMLIPLVVGCKKNKNDPAGSDSTSDVVDSGSSSDTKAEDSEAASDSESASDTEEDSEATSDVEDSEATSDSEEDSESASDSEEDTESASDTEADEIETDENGYQKDDLDGLDFDGKEIKVLACSDSIYEELGLTAEQMNETKLNRALYLRDMKVKTRLDVKVLYHFTSRDDMVKEAEVLETEGGVDLYAPYSRLSASLMMRGYTKNLLDVPNLDLTAPWWAQDLIDKVTIHDRLYVASGDISPSLLAQTFIICYNKDLFETVKNDKLAKYDAESLYEMVNEGTWTLDAMMEIAKGVGFGTEDGKDADDIYGFTVDPINVDCFYQGAGLKVLDYNPDGSVKVSEDLGSAKTHGLVEDLVEFFDSADVFAPGYDDPNRNVQIQSFYQGNTLFNVNCMVYVPIMVNKGVNVGILPIPKYDTEQERYYDITGFAYLVWSVSRGTTDESLEAAGAVMECMASEGYRTVTPTVYNEIYRDQSSSSLDDYKMWETIRNSVEIEGGRLFVDVFENKTYAIFRGAVVGRTTDYMSSYEGQHEAMVGYADGLNDLMKTMEDIYGG